MQKTWFRDPSDYLDGTNRMVDVVDENGFKKRVLYAKGVVLVNFWAWWSDECRIMSSLMFNAAHFLDEGDSIVQVNWDDQRGLTKELGIFGVPTLLIYASGCERARYYGTMKGEDLIELIIAAKNRDGY